MNPEYIFDFSDSRPRHKHRTEEITAQLLERLVIVSVNRYQALIYFLIYLKYDVSRFLPCGIRLRTYLFISSIFVGIAWASLSL